MDEVICGKESCTNGFALYHLGGSSKHYCASCAYKINQVSEADVCVRDPAITKGYVTVNGMKSVSIRIVTIPLDQRGRRVEGVVISLDCSARLTTNKNPIVQMSFEEFVELQTLLSKAEAWLEKFTVSEEDHDEDGRKVMYRRLKTQGELT